MFTEEGFAGELLFWEEGGTTDYPRISYDHGQFFADLHLKEFSSMYDIFKAEENVQVLFGCDGQGGYREIHVSGGSKTEQVKEMTDALLAKLSCSGTASIQYAR